MRSVATLCLPRTTLRCTGVGVCAAGKGARWWWWMMERYKVHVAVACGRVAGMGEDEVVVRWDVVVGVESRGFIFGGALAQQLGAGFVPVRKRGKLPSRVIEEEYELEYGRDVLAIHEDAIRQGQKVLVVDDLLATGGTMAATLRLIERLGGVVVAAEFLIELRFLKGRDRLKGYRVESLIQYD